MNEPAPSSPTGRGTWAVALPIGTLGLAYALWWMSDRLVNVGPLDRAQFGWLVVIPIWLSAPIVAGYAWRRVEPRRLAVSAIIVGLVIAGIAGDLLWQSTAQPECTFGSAVASADLVIPSALFGLTVGGGLVAAGLVTRLEFLHASRTQAIVAGLASSGVASL